MASKPNSNEVLGPTGEELQRSFLNGWVALYSCGTTAQHTKMYNGSRYVEHETKGHALLLLTLGEIE